MVRGVHNIRVEANVCVRGDQSCVTEGACALCTVHPSTRYRPHYSGGGGGGNRGGGVGGYGAWCAVGEE